MNKIIAFDLDDVICKRSNIYESIGFEKYNYCEPILHNIDIVNSLYYDGYIIKIYTARGMSYFSGDVNKIYSNLYILTINQLNNWNVKFHELVMGKLHYDILIDDKVLNSCDLNNVNDIKKKLIEFNTLK